MRAMIFEKPGTPLLEAELPDPEPAPGQLLLRVRACGVCRTDVHIRDGELTTDTRPIVPGHQIVGIVERGGSRTTTAPGTRVGVPWLGWTDGTCRFCQRGRENLCTAARFTGLDIHGGFAELTVADERYCFPLADGPEDLALAPLLCGGLIGHRALRMTGDAPRLGLYGFGAAAHIVAQVALSQGREVYAFTRASDSDSQAFALELGCTWAGDALKPGPQELDAAIVFAPAGELVPAALHACGRGGIVVCAGIHMTDIPTFPYVDLWEERQIRSVANLTREDAVEFLDIAPRVPVHTHVTAFALEQAEAALDAIRSGSIQGAAVLDLTQRS